MTSQDRDFEELIRSALCAAAESIEPSGGGLERIRHRLDSQRSARALLAGFADWVMLLRVRLSVRFEPVTEAGRSALGGMAARRPQPARPAGRAGRQHARPLLPLGRLEAARPWLRPALAVSAVVAVVMVGFVTLHGVQQTIISPTNSVTAPGAHHGGGRPDAVSSPIGVKPSQYAPGSGPQPGAGVVPAATCSPTPKAPKATPSPTVSGTAPAATPTPAGSSSAGPTPSPTGSGGTGAQPSPTDTAGTSGTGGGGTGGTSGTGGTGGTSGTSGTGGTTATTTAIILAPLASTGCGTASPAAPARASATSPGA